MSDGVSREVAAITFGRVLKRFREQRGFSQEDLAAGDNDRTYPSLLEHGRRTPSLVTIYKLCSKLSVKPSELIRAAYLEYQASLERSEKQRAAIERNRGAPGKPARARQAKPSEIFGGKAPRELAARAFGHVLRMTRTEQKLTEIELAALSEIEPDYISLVERGLRTPSIAIIRRLAAGLGIHADQLIERAYKRLAALQYGSTGQQDKDQELEVRPFWRTDI